MTTASERFLRYVTFDTKSDEFSETCPSTDKQKVFGAYLVEEMKEIGIQDAYMDADGYIYGTVPGDPKLPTIGLIAHMDTSPSASDADVQAKTVLYTGEDICLNKEKVASAKKREESHQENQNTHAADPVGETSPEQYPFWN